MACRKANVMVVSATPAGVFDSKGLETAGGAAGGAAGATAGFLFS